MGRPLRWMLGSLAVLLAGLAVFAVRQQREISGLRSTVSDQAAQLADNQGRVQALSGQLASEQQGRLAAGQALRRSTAENARLAQALGLDTSDLTFWRAQRLHEAARRYAPALDRLDLAPDGREALLALLADRADAVRDAREIALRDGIAEDSADMALAVRTAAAEVDTDIRSLIGPAIDGFFPPAAPAAPTVNVAVYNPPPVVVPVYYPAQPAVSSSAPAYEPEPQAQPTYYAPYAPLLVVSSFRPNDFGRGRRFAGPRPEPPQPARSAPRPEPIGGGPSFGAFGSHGRSLR